MYCFAIWKAEARTGRTWNVEALWLSGVRTAFMLTWKNVNTLTVMPSRLEILEQGKCHNRVVSLFFRSILRRAM
jgi:hypothetical protein